MINKANTILEDTIINIWTDGGCINNPGEGGIGIIMKYKDHTKELLGYAPNTTNNQMELLAVIVALKSLKRKCTVQIWTDSTYLKNGIETWIHNWKKNNWKTADNKPVKNQKLWLEMYNLTNFHNVTFKWIKGHNGQTENEKADTLCKEAMKNKVPMLDRTFLELLNN